METDTLTLHIEEKDSSKLFDQIQNDFIGLNTKYKIATGEESRKWHYKNY